MSGDARVLEALQFLDGAYERQPGDLAPSLLIGELVETRHHLARCLDVIGETADACRASLRVIGGQR